jgi:dTDP-glucose 4,6-dehydratase
VRLGNLHPTRDLSYVANTVDGFVSAASAPEAVGQTINLGSGQETSIGDLAQLIASLMGKALTIESETQRVRPDGSEVDRLLADTTLAQRLLGWQPQVSLDDGLRRTIDWIQMHREQYRAGVYVL